MRHANPSIAILFNEGKAAAHVQIRWMLLAYLFQKITIDLIQNLQVTWYQPFKQGHGPGFQRLRQQRVIGVCTGTLRDGPGFFP